jgi:hypothetical protein
MSVLKLPFLVDLPQKVGDLLLSVTSSFNPYFRKYFELVYRKNVVIVTLTTGTMFLLFTCIHFSVWGILQRWFMCELTAYEVVYNCQKFEKHCLEHCNNSPEYVHSIFHFITPKTGSHGL